MSDEGDQEVIQEENARRAHEASNWFDRFFWLGPRVAQARAAAYGPGQPGHEHYLMARQIQEAMARIGHAEKASWVALMLNGIAAELLVRAHMARAGRTVYGGPLGEADWQSARHVSAMEAAWNRLSSRDVSTLMAMVGADRVSAMTRLSSKERERFAAALHDFVLSLTEALDAEAERLDWALFARWSRLALAGVMVAVVVGLAAMGLYKRIVPNLALHRPVSASSTNAWAPDPNGLTDGITDVMGVHTNAGGQQWLVIDLGEVKEFDTVVVYNRPDCCAERAVPLRIQVSSDNRSYTQIAKRDESFDTWTATNLHAKGRYVRLENTPPNFLHLAEVEVY